MIKSQVIQHKDTPVYPSLLKCKNNSGICLSTKEVDDFRFIGIWVYWGEDRNDFIIDGGEITFDKRDFRPFSGEVVLSNG